MPEKKPTKKALLAEFRAKMGRCQSLTGKGDECGNWGVDRVNDRAYCGQHLTSVLLEEDRRSREVARVARLNARIDAFLAWTTAHPSVHDSMPR